METKAAPLREEQRACLSSTHPKNYATSARIGHSSLRVQNLGERRPSLSDWGAWGAIACQVPVSSSVTSRLGSHAALGPALDMPFSHKNAQPADGSSFVLGSRHMSFS